MGILTSYNGWEDKTGYLIGNTRYFENLLANQNGYIVSINHNDTCLFGPSYTTIVLVFSNNVNNFFTLSNSSFKLAKGPSA